jgi:hypothetical protein
MSDIQRNGQKKTVQAEVKPSDVQIHFGNAKIIELKLLESINKQLGEIVKLLKEAK